MTPKDKKTLFASFKITEKLFKRNKSAESWGDNIVLGSKTIETDDQWKHYQAWLTNPLNYDFEECEKMKTLDSLPDYENINLEYDNGLEPIFYKNGSECIVHVTKKLVSMQDDEKTLS